jgi:hypothetical protein
MGRRECSTVSRSTVRSTRPTSRRDLRPRLTLHGSPAALAATSDELALPEGPAARLRTVDAAVEAAEQDLAERRARDDDRHAEWLQKRCPRGNLRLNHGVSAVRQPLKGRRAMAARQSRAASCYTTASSVAAPGHLGATHKRGSGAKTARAREGYSSDGLETSAPST